MKPLAQGGNPAPSSDNNLINGKMDFDCATVAAGGKTKCTNNAGISKFKFTTGKTHRLRLINAGAEGIQRFSIDGHDMTVIANDFVPIVSSSTHEIPVSPLTSIETIYNQSSHPRNRSTNGRSRHRQSRNIEISLLDAF